MVKTIKTSVLLIFILCCLSCNVGKMDNTLVEYKRYFNKYYSLDNLFSHFPDNVKQLNVYSGMFYPPQEDNHYGYAILIMKNNKDDINKIKAFKTIVVDSVCSNSFYALSVNEDSLIQKSFLYPIVDFREADWFLGESKKVIYNSILKRSVPVPIYSYPKDLKVYLIDAKKGDFWKSDSTSNNFNLLGDWQHGYSKGYAISEASNLVAYWLVVW